LVASGGQPVTFAHSADRHARRGGSACSRLRGTGAEQAGAGQAGPSPFPFLGPATATATGEHHQPGHRQRRAPDHLAPGWDVFPHESPSALTGKSPALAYSWHGSIAAYFTFLLPLNGCEPDIHADTCQVRQPGRRPARPAGTTPSCGPRRTRQPTGAYHQFGTTNMAAQRTKIADQTAARRALSRASRTIGNSGHGHPDSGEVVFLCIAIDGVNFRFCRDEVRPPWALRQVARSKGPRHPSSRSHTAARCVCTPPEPIAERDRRSDGRRANSRRSGAGRPGCPPHS